MSEPKRVSAEIKLTKGEPLKIEGNFDIIGIDGKSISTDYSKEAYLCTCGRSKNKPFCDESHKR